MASPNYGQRGRAADSTSQAGKLRASCSPHADQMEAASPATLHPPACGVTAGKAELWTGDGDSVVEDAARNSAR